MSRKEELQDLINQGLRDKRAKILAREFFSPAKDSPYQEIKDEKNRAIFILYRCNYSCRKLGQMFSLDKNTILSIISRVSEEIASIK